jgi:hypothetical protein
VTKRLLYKTAGLAGLKARIRSYYWWWLPPFGLLVSAGIGSSAASSGTPTCSSSYSTLVPKYVLLATRSMDSHTTAANRRLLPAASARRSWIPPSLGIGMLRGVLQQPRLDLARRLLGSREFRDVECSAGAEQAATAMRAHGADGQGRLYSWMPEGCGTETMICA